MKPTHSQKEEHNSMYHCVECFDKAAEKIVEKDLGYQPNPVYVSAEQYPYCKKYGLAEGLLKWMRDKRKTNKLSLGDEVERIRTNAEKLKKSDKSDLSTA